MNKKFSTLMAGLLLAGGLTNLTFAEKLPIKGDIGKDFKSGDVYFLVNDFGTSQYVYGFEKNSTDEKKVVEKVANITSDGFSGDDYKNYLWEVVETYIVKDATDATKNKYGYTLKNVGTGAQLIFNSNGTVDTDTSDDAEQLKDENWGSYTLWFQGAAQYKSIAANAGVAYPGVAYADGKISSQTAMLNLHYGNQNMGVVSSSGVPFKFYALDEVKVDITELNDLYNSTGFNLVLNQDKWKDVDNIFAKEGDRIMAVEVSTDDVKSADANSASFPQGTYFVVNNKLGAAPEDGKELYDFLMNSTLIAVSPSVNDINDADWRKAGQGFQLIKKAGRDLVKVGTNKDLQGDDVSVYNACFKVTKNIDGYYALQVPTFYYNEKTGADKQTKGEVAIKVTAKDGDDHGDLYLTTDAKAENFIFDFKEVNTVSYTKFLNQNAKAVYNIQFVNDDLAGKYLFTPAYEKVAYAKGAKFVDPTAPEAQYIITDVDLDNNNITFENRANKAYRFTAKFYQEADGVYSMAIKSDEINNTKVTDLSLQANGDLKAETSVKMHTQWVKLTPVTVDMFAGAWDVDNLTEVTMSFARDEESTSNRLFTTLAKDGKTLKVSDDQSDAIQFQLVKDEKPTYITNEYAYLSSDNKVKKYADGDTVAYYTYAIQAYKDGEAIKDKFVNWNSKWVLDSNDEYTFVIKTNATDGSTIVMAKENIGKGYKMLVVSDWKNETKTISEFDRSNIVDDGQLQDVHADYVKTFLKVESPEVTLDPKSTYVTMKNDINSYYLSKTTEGEAILDEVTTLRLFVTDADRKVPNFLVSTGWNETTGEREFLFNPSDSVKYYVAKGEYNKKYQWDNINGATKLIFKTGKLSGENAANDTIYTSIKGNDNVAVSNVADQNEKVQAGLNFFKFQIVEDPDADGLYMMRQAGNYLASKNGRLTLDANREDAIRFEVTNVDAPTANETINAANNNVVVAGVNGAVVVKGAEGKNVIVSTILGKVVANEVLTSDNAQITAPAGVVVVSVDGESFKVVVK